MDDDKAKQYRLKLAKVTAIIERLQDGQQLDIKLTLPELKTLQTELQQMLAALEKPKEAPLQDPPEQPEEEEKQEEEPSRPESRLASLRVCCAFYEAENKWYGAVVRGRPSEKSKTVDITWLGLGEEDSVSFRNVELSKVPSDVEIGTACECLYQENGLWYPCTVKAKEEPVATATGVEVEVYSVEFTQTGFQTTVPINFLRVEGDKARAPHEEEAGVGGVGVGSKRPKDGDDRAQIEEEEKEGGEERAEGGDGGAEGFVVPEHLKAKEGDTAEELEAKKRKKKALKWSYKQKQEEKAHKQRKSAWSQFLNKASKKRKGYFAQPVQQSIFKTTDTLGGRVGMVNSGRGASQPQRPQLHRRLPHPEEEG